MGVAFQMERFNTPYGGYESTTKSTENAVYLYIQSTFHSSLSHSLFPRLIEDVISRQDTNCLIS